MTNSISINPILQTNALGSFNVQSKGLIQGTAYDDPATRYALAGGYLAEDETLPMWGGVGIANIIPSSVAGDPNPALGTRIKRATSLTAAAALQLTGFSVFDQAHNMINTPQSPVPLSAARMMVNYYKLGSRARIAVAMDPALVSLEGDIITSLVSWDFGAQKLIPYAAAYADDAVVSGTWAAGVVTLTLTTGGELAPGDDFTISGAVPDAYNGNFTALAGTTGTTLKYALADNPGTLTTHGKLVAGGGALPVKILEVQADGCMTVSYDPVTGFATWERNGACAVIQI